MQSATKNQKTGVQNDKDLSAGRVYNVLIAENEELNYLFIETVLNRNYENIKIFHAKNGEEAVEICNTGNIDLVLMDLKMPDMDGLKATRQIKQRFPDLPVIAQTAYLEIEKGKEALAAGCSNYLTKPLSKNKLLKEVKKYLEQQ